MSQVQFRRCNGCLAEAETPQEMQGWVQVAVGIGSPTMQPHADGWDFCEKCWGPGNTIYEIYMNTPAVQLAITDSIEAEEARLERIKAAEVGMMATYEYPQGIPDDGIIEDERPDSNT